MRTKIQFNSDFEAGNTISTDNLVINDKNIQFYGNLGETVEVVIEFAVSDFSELFYAFYGKEFVVSNEECHYKCDYGYIYPFSMITFFTKKSGITLIINSPEFKKIELKKDKSGCYCVFEIFCKDTKPIEIITEKHSSDYKEGIKLYQTWYIKKFGSLPASCDAVKDVFHIRRYFFNRELCNCSIINGEEACLDKVYNNDCEQFGGIDAGLLFDFAYNKETNIRCGNINPICFSEDLQEQLKGQISEITSKNGCIFFAYFDPYLIQDNSEADKLYRKSLPILNKDGSFCYVWGEKQWSPCLAEEEWQKFSVSYINKAIKGLDCAGIYLDEFGNGSQFTCHNMSHRHLNNFSQKEIEAEYLSRLQREVSGKLWMCEFPPTDYAENKMDIVLCDTRALINIYRFIFPDLKFVRIIGCDLPLGDNEWDINKSFFNGEGLWIDNDADNLEWYPDNIKKLIRKQYEILKKYSNFFASPNVEPLFCITDEGVLVNKFIYQNMAILTFINPTDTDITTEIKLKNMTLLKNVYSDTKIDFGKENTVILKIKAKDVGCALCSI